MKEIVFIRGNPQYGTPEQHRRLEEKIKELAKKLNLKFTAIESDKPLKTALFSFNKDDTVFIGFSRGTRYFKRMKGLKIGIGSKFGTYQFVNKCDKTSHGDISKESLDCHFLLTDKTLNEIENIIKSRK